MATDEPAPVVTGMRWCGDRALLVETRPDAVAAVHAALADAVDRVPLAGVLDLVRGARTVLVLLDAAAVPREVTAAVRGLRPGSTAAVEPGEVVDIPVVYDGDDLADVAEHTGLTAPEVVATHLGQTWTVAFAGFAPGFGYLVGEHARLEVPRRSDARTSVPAGAVGLAAHFSGVYPRASPGGWQLIGRTDATLWDLDRDPPALLTPGTRVHFRDVTP